MEILGLAVIYRASVPDTLDPLFLRRVSRFGRLAHSLFLTPVVLNPVISFQKLLVSLAHLLPLSLSAAEKLQVVTSFSILADMTQQIGGEHIVTSNMVAPTPMPTRTNPVPVAPKRCSRPRWSSRTGSALSRGVVPRTIDYNLRTLHIALVP